MSVRYFVGVLQKRDKATKGRRWSWELVFRDPQKGPAQEHFDRVALEWDRTRGKVLFHVEDDGEPRVLSLDVLTSPFDTVRDAGKTVRQDPG